MAKSKNGISRASGPHKNHGPKKKMFHCWSQTMRLKIARAGLLNKYNNKDSFILSCQARGLRHGSAEEWDARFNMFLRLENRQAQDTWLSTCKTYVDPGKDKKKKASSK